MSVEEISGDYFEIYPFEISEDLEEDCTEIDGSIFSTLEKNNDLVLWNDRLITRDAFLKEFERFPLKTKPSTRYKVENTSFQSIGKLERSNETTFLFLREIEPFREANINTRCAKKSKADDKKHKGWWNKTAHKIGKFVKEHKVAIIVGVVIVAAIVATAVILGGMAASGAAAGAGGALGGLSDGDDSPSPAPKQSPNKGFVDIVDEGRALREEAFKSAEIKACEQRYQGMVYPQEDVQRMQSRANEAFDQFKTDFMNSIDKSDIVETGLLLTGLATVARTPGIGEQAFSVGISTLAGIDLVERYKDKFNTMYQPVADMYRDFHQMDQTNRLASLEECQKTGYRPHLEFHPTEPQTDPHRMVFIDTTNPNFNNQITVVME